MPVELGHEAVAHQLQVADLNRAIDTHLARRTGYLKTVHPRRVATLHEGIARQRAELATFSEQLFDIAGRYHAVDALRPSSPLQRLALCLMPGKKGEAAPFEGIHVISDFDKSMSMTENLHDSERVYVMPNMPGSIPLEKFMDEHGREHLADGFVAHVQKPLRRYPHLFRDGGRHAIQWRPGTLELFGKLRALNIKRTILSANVGEFIRGALDETHLADDTQLEIKALTHNDISSTDKATAIQLLAAKNPHLAVVYIGDGASDMKVVEAYKKGAIAAIFALEECEFERQLTTQGIPHFTYSNFHDIDAQLEQAGCFAKNAAQQAA